MKKIIYAPTLHPALAPHKLPSEVHFMCPGLNCNKTQNYFTPAGLPLNSAQAKAVLEELLSMGSSFGKNGDLKLIAGKGWLEREEERKQNLRDENNALNSFAESGEIPANHWRSPTAFPSQDSIAENFINAQKALLLAWEHEECILSMRDLEEKISFGEDKLAEILSGGEENFNLSDGNRTDSPNMQPARPDYSWRVILDAMGTFLPEQSIIFTAFTPMIDDLRTAGILEPLPGDIAEVLENWPDKLVASLLTARLPLWRLLGYVTTPQERPWLAATYDILAAPKLEQEIKHGIY